MREENFSSKSKSKQSEEWQEIEQKSQQSFGAPLRRSVCQFNLSSSLSKVSPNTTNQHSFKKQVKSFNSELLLNSSLSKTKLS
jgi:hypothetical protein